MLKRITIKQKIYLLGYIKLALMMLMGSIALTQIAKISIGLMDIAEEDIPIANNGY
jgi:methyl-accepting chemotaxis protein